MSRRLFLSLIACMLAARIIGPPSGASSTEEFKGNSTRDNASLRVPLVNPRIVITKGKRRLERYSDGNVVRTYRVGLGLSPVDDKIRAGDRRTPEGEFYICEDTQEFEKLRIVLEFWHGWIDARNHNWLY